jgi:hypothetical protein
MLVTIGVIAIVGGVFAFKERVNVIIYCGSDPSAIAGSPTCPAFINSTFITTIDDPADFYCGTILGNACHIAVSQILPLH